MLKERKKYIPLHKDEQHMYSGVIILLLIAYFLLQPSAFSSFFRL